MINFFTTSYFCEPIQALKKVKRGVYSTVEDEIKNGFSGSTIEEIRQNNDMILLDETRIVIKLRLPDKKHKLSKKDGFRLIYLVYKDADDVAFLDIYPKNGPMQQLDIDDSKVIELIRQYIDEKEQDLLGKFELLE